MKKYRILSELVNGVKKAEDRIIEKLIIGEIKQEPDLTSRLLESIETNLDGLRKNGVVIRTSVLTDRGRNSEESLYGADFIGTLKIRLPIYSIDKGFLIQAKLFKDKNKNLSEKDFNDIVQQCKKMISITPCSYLALYTPYGIKLLPANMVINSTYESMKNLSKIENNFYLLNLSKFYKEHFECIIGDYSIDTTDIKKVYQQTSKCEKKFNELHIEIIDIDTYPEYLI